MYSVSSTTYVAWDIETTGFDPFNNEILQIGAVGSQGTFETLVKIMKGIPSDASKVHNIYMKDVQSAPSLKEALDKFFKFIEEEVKKTEATTLVLLGHNSWVFDDVYLVAAFLSIYTAAQTEHFLSKLNVKILSADTKKAFKAKHKLNNVKISANLTNALHYSTGETLEHAHTAIADAEAVYKLLPYVQENLEYRSFLEAAVEALQRRYKNKLEKKPAFSNEITKNLLLFQKNQLTTCEKQDGKRKTEYADLEPYYTGETLCEAPRKKTNKNLYCEKCLKVVSRFFAHECQYDQQFNSFRVFEYQG